MVYVLKSAVQLLTRNKSLSTSMFRKCSNQELPWLVKPYGIAIYGNNSFGDRTTRPGRKVAERIMFEGKPNNFQDSEELLEGALYAIEMITQTLSSNQDLENSDLVEYTTEHCFKHIVSMSSGNLPERDNFKKFDSKVTEEVFQKFLDPWLEKKLDEAEKHIIETHNLARKNSLILKEDILFSWIENMNPEKNQMRIVTISSTRLGEIMNRMKQISDHQEIMKYLSSNPSIICCNWDFNKV